MYSYIYSIYSYSIDQDNTFTPYIPPFSLSLSTGLFLHMEGQGTPMFGPGGVVVGTDLQQSLIPELMEYLKFAHMNQIYVFICLWNGAFVTPVINERLHGLVKDEIKLQSYITTALTPIVRNTFPSLWVFVCVLVCVCVWV